MGRGGAVGHGDSVARCGAPSGGGFVVVRVRCASGGGCGVQWGCGCAVVVPGAGASGGTCPDGTIYGATPPRRWFGRPRATHHASVSGHAPPTPPTPSPRWSPPTARPWWRSGWGADSFRVRSFRRRTEPSKN
ncbi:hypothetical protein CU044_7084 [Streptomyces sp. L-9-10]|nr:hypothetical protein CU044_7084 [Streptomyces sp. L-9-10]